MIVPAVGLVLLFMLCGVACLVVPERIQRYWIRNCRLGDFTNPLLPLVESPTYLVWLRIIGAFVLVLSAFILYLFLIVSFRESCVTCRRHDAPCRLGLPFQQV